MSYFKKPFDELRQEIELEDFYRNEGDRIWWTSEIDVIGQPLFSFDKKKVYHFWLDYPQELTAEEIKIFKKENPGLAELKS